MNEKQIERWEKIRKKGIFFYLLNYWIIPLGIFAPIFAQFMGIYMKEGLNLKKIRQLLNPEFLKLTAILMGICTVFSLVFGFITWNKSEKAFKSIKSTFAHD